MRNKNILLLFACVSFLQGCGDSAERSGEYLTSAKAYYEKENYNKAKLELRNALQIDDKLAEAYYYFALVSEKEKNWKEMFNGLTQAIKLDPENHEARLKLAKLYLLGGNVDQANSEIDFLLKSRADDPNVIALKGVIFLKQGDTASALAEAKKTLAIDSKHIDSIGLIVGVYLAQKDYAAAEKEVNKALVNIPDNLALYVLKLQVHLKSENVQLVEQGYQEIIKRFPEESEFSYALAKFYVSTKRDSKALNLLQTVVEKNSDQIKPKLVLVDYLLQKDVKTAETTIKKFIEENSTETDLYLKLAKLYILQSRGDEAKEPLNWIIEHNNSKDKKGKKARSILAKLAIQKGDTATSLKLVKEVLAVDKRNLEALLLKARISMINGEHDEAITGLRGILTDYSKSDEAMVLLGQAFLMKKSPVLAEENFRKALEANPGNFQAVMPVVSRMIKSNDVGRAEEILQKALKINPNHESGLQALAQIKLMKKDWAGTQEIADKIGAKPNGKGFSKYLSGKISQEQGNYQEAVEKYKLALLDIPTYTDALKSMIVCYEKLEQREKMHAYLDEFMTKNPTIASSIIFKSQLYGADKNWDKAIEVLNKGLDKWPKAVQFYKSIAMIYLGTNQKEKAIDIYKRGIKEIPNNIELNMLLASTYERKEDYDNAVKTYQEIVDKNPEVDVAVNNLVSILLDHYPGKENMKRAVTLSERFKKSKQPYFLDTYGWALLQNGNIKEAVKTLDQVVSKAPKVPVFKYHLGVAHHKNGNNQDALRFLESAIELGESQQGKFIENNEAKQLLKIISANVG